MAKNKSEEINFQQYVDSVKQKQIPRNIFINLLQDISNSDADRLRKLNAILLTELTLKHSNTEKLKYLNDIHWRQTDQSTSAMALVVFCPTPKI